VTYKEALTRSMDTLAADPARRFVGYGLLHGRCMGTIKCVDDSKLIETPVAENLMVGIAIGLSLKGLRPLVFIERFDFALCAADAIVNHLSAADAISRGEFSPAAILRCVVGNRTKPLFTGETHTQNFTEAFRSMVSFPVHEMRTPEDVVESYESAAELQANGISSMLVEFKDLI